MKKLYSFIICLLLAQMTFSQVTTNYNAKWFFGVNTGLTWQSTDVQNKMRTGWGLTLGRSFNYHTASFVSFDIRGRFLRGFWYGQDTRTSNFTQPNIALSQGSTNYRDTLGFAVHNFQTENYLLNLELVAHFNRFRERTRWDPYIFGGIGLNWSQTYGDYLDRDVSTGDNAMYDWDITQLSRSDLRNLQDGVYETALDGSDQNSFRFFTSKSLGFGLGYQVGRAVTIGLEHKTTFTNVDDFDGFLNPNDKNDIYHYTSAYIQFRLFGGKTDQDVVNNTNPTNEPPVVVYSQPSTSGTEVSNPNYTIQARIKNVFDRENVIFVQNGAQVTAFTYNPNTDLFAANVTLIEGQNTFVLTGNNQFGTDSKTTIIIYKPEVILSPVVSFIQPSVNPITVTDPNYTVTGNVLNVKQKNQISVTFNGTTRNDFTFNSNNGNVNLNVNLVQGNNTVQITGTNSAGTDTESTVIIYKYVPAPTPPVVYFTDPTSNPLTVATSTYTVKGKVQNVESQSGVKLTQNGSVKSGFIFNPTTDDISFNASLVEGTNTFVLTGTNADGSANATTVIVYNRSVVNPPVVTILNPVNTTANVSNPQFAFAGNILNITSKSQATLTLNGANVSSFTFNSSTKAIAANLTLIQGNNTVVLTGTNADGTDSKTVNIVYTPVVTEPAPVVYFTSPSSSPTNVSNGTYTLKAKVLNVNGSQNITFKRNGFNQSNFTYNPTTDDFESVFYLSTGQNVFELTGTNSIGSASATTTIVLNTNVPKPPVVTITNPSGSSANTNVAQYPFVGNIQNVTTRSQVSMLVNGTMYNGFNFTSGTGVVTANLTLNQGVNTVELKGTNADGTDAKQVTLIYNPIVTEQPPVVTYINPSSSPTNVNVGTYNVQATVANVSAPSGINISHNGNNVSVFTFGSFNLNFNLNLVEGANVVVVTGTNTAGVDSKSTTIIYTKPVATPAPVVTFVNPPSTPTNVSVANYNVKATVLNVNSANDITVKVNGVSTSSFTYNGTTKLVDLTVNLLEGNNSIEVKGTNSTGSDTKTTYIVYTKPIVLPAPVVTFVNPPSTPTNVSAANYNIKATVLNVNSANDITVKINGVSTSSFTYNGTTKLVDLTVNLLEGNNSIEVKGTNTSGSDTKTTYIVYTKPIVLPAPVVTFVNPPSTPTNVSVANYNVKATVLNVGGNSDITVKVNSAPTSSFTYNATTKLVDLTVTLLEGNNSIEVKGTNSTGSDTKTTNIVYTKPVVILPPVVAFIDPATNPKNVTVASYNVRATVLNVASSNDITVKVNGVQTNSFTYTAATNIVNFTTALNLGANTVEIKGTNAGGSDTKTTVINYAQPCVVPTVSAVTPNTSAYTTDKANLTISLASTQITSNSQITVKVGTNSIPFNFNSSAQTITSDVALNLGMNAIKVTVTNSCGSDEFEYKVIRTACDVPTLSLNFANVANNQRTFAPKVTLVLNVTKITTSSQIEVTVDNKIIPFTFSLANGTIEVDYAVIVGTSNFKVKATNNCGTAEYLHTVIRDKSATKLIPQVTITDPSSSPSTVSSPSYQVNFSTMQIIDKAEIIMRVNEVIVPVTFDKTTNTGSGTVNLNGGNNSVEIVVTNPVGSASSTVVLINSGKGSTLPKGTTPRGGK